MSQSAPAQPTVSFEEYFEAELTREGKHEWLGGVVYAMGGGSFEHARLAANVIGLLKGRLAGRCTVLSSDVMIFIPATELATYPDVCVVCGPPELKRVSRAGRVIGEALLNPRVVVEVLSPSTEGYDRGEKLAHMMRIDALDAYVLVAQAKPEVEILRRPKGRGHWAREVAGPGAFFNLEGAELGVDEIYAS